MNRRAARLQLSALLASGVLLGACSSMSMAQQPARVADGALVGPNGMTLYTFDNDKAAGTSACNGPCAANWPPFMAAAGASSSGEWTVITRDDGSRQWAYKGKPVYYWAKDAKPGDRTGDGVNKVWHTARP